MMATSVHLARIADFTGAYPAARHRPPLDSRLAREVRPVAVAQGALEPADEAVVTKRLTELLAEGD
jgi:hypothetical protein